MKKPHKIEAAIVTVLSVSPVSEDHRALDQIFSGSKHTNVKVGADPMQDSAVESRLRNTPYVLVLATAYRPPFRPFQIRAGRNVAESESLAS